MEEQSTGNGQGRKQLKRASKERVLGGVSKGIADYFGIDAIYVMFAFVGLTMFGFFFVPIIYLVLWLVLPTEEDIDLPIGERAKINIDEVKGKLTNIFNQVRKQVMSLGLNN